MPRVQMVVHVVVHLSWTMWPELESVCTHKALLCSAVEDTMMCSKEERESGRMEGQHFLEVGD